MKTTGTAHTDRERSKALLLHLRRLQRRHVFNRILQLLSIALVVGLLFDISTTAFYSLWSVKLPFPFLFEILFAVLILKDLPRWKLEKTAIMVDRKFSLKDRLYSYLRFTVDTKVSERVRLAQLREVYDHIDFGSQVRSMRMRIPPILFAVLPLFLALMFLSWNAEYAPPGINSRILSLTSFPTSYTTPSVAVLPGDDPGILSALPGDENTGTRKSGVEDPGDREDRMASDNSSAQSLTPGEMDQTGGDEALEAPGSAGTGSSGAGGGAPGLKDAELENLRSNPVSQTVSAPVPPNLAPEAAQSFLELPDASKFLDLVPGQGSGSLADLDEETIALFETHKEEFPEQYREHLQNYYWELKKWSQDR